MLSKELDKRIEMLERQISEGKIKLIDVERELNSLKLQAFEEDIREQDNTQQLLNG